MAKRNAISDLNHDNWADEEEPEEAGTFRQADKNTLQGRVIKKAVRRGIKQAVSQLFIQKFYMILYIFTISYYISLCFRTAPIYFLVSEGSNPHQIVQRQHLHLEAVAAV